MRSDLKKIGEQKSTDLVGQTERALYLLDVISTITDVDCQVKLTHFYV